MRIIRHTARDMRHAMRAVREQLGDDAVILSSRRTHEGVEVTAAVDFDAATLEAGGFANELASAAATTSRTSPTPAPPGPSAIALTSPAARRVETAGWDPDLICAAAREAVVEHAESLVRGNTADKSRPAVSEKPKQPADPPAQAAETAPTLAPAPQPAAEPAPFVRTEVPVFRRVTDPVAEAQSAALAPLAPEDGMQGRSSFQAPEASAPAVADDMGNELKTLRRMLETQLAHLAWNDLTRRAPIHTEMLRELTEIGITHDLAEHLVRQLPEDTDLTFARRFTIAGLSQYLGVTGDRWIDGGHVAFVGATGVGKTTTLAKIAVRWVLRHGPRDIALVAGDSVRIGAQDQLQALGQLLGVRVYTDRFENLPALLQGLGERLILIDTPGSSVRDPSLAGRTAILASLAGTLETALVLSASTQAGALEEALKHYSTARLSCCVLTKIDEAASLGGALSVLIRARLPVSYVSEGQRVPEDLRPARALELVSSAVRLAKASGSVADEDLLRRRFGKTAHGFT